MPIGLLSGCHHVTAGQHLRCVDALFAGKSTSDLAV